MSLGKCPSGYRFLVQLTTDTPATAPGTLAQMFGKAVADVARVQRGHFKGDDRLRYTWTPGVGVRVFIPLGTVLRDPIRRTR